MNWKRITVLVLVVSLLVLGGCSRFSSEESENLYNDIQKLENAEFTVADEQLIQQLEERYHALTTELQKEVSNYSLLGTAKARVAQQKENIKQYNDHIARLVADLSPDALEEAAGLLKRYETMPQGNRASVDIASLETLQTMMETWYGAESVYEQMEQSLQQEDFEKAMALADEAMKPTVTTAVRPYYLTLAGNVRIAYVKYLAASDETEPILSHFAVDMFSKMSKTQKVEFAMYALEGTAAQVRKLMDAGEIDEALQIMGSVWPGLFTEATTNPLTSLAGECYVLKANALYDAKSYKEAAVFCRDYRGFRVSIPERYHVDLMDVMVDASCAYAEQKMKEKDYQEAIDLLLDAGEKMLTEAQRTKLRAQSAKIYDMFRPKNGAVIKKSECVGSGYGKLVVINNMETDAVVRIFRYENFSNVGTPAYVYVRSGEEAKFSIPDGDYDMAYKTGTGYINETVMFAEDCSEWRHPGFQNFQFGWDARFTTTRNGSRIEYTVNTWELGPR